MIYLNHFPNQNLLLIQLFRAGPQQDKTEERPRNMNKTFRGTMIGHKNRMTQCSSCMEVKKKKETQKDCLHQEYLACGKQGFNMNLKPLIQKER